MDGQDGTRFGDAAVAGDATDILAGILSDNGEQIEGDEAKLEGIRGSGTYRTETLLYHYHSRTYFPTP